VIELEARPEGKPCRMKSSGGDNRNLVLKESDLEESFARSSGPGGQHVNKVSSAVTLRHRPTGVSVTVEDSRSQAVNRKIARTRLREAVLLRLERAESERRARRETERRRKSPRPKKLKESILRAKRQRAELKRQRRGVLD
jgi:peptide chain release factor